MDINENAIRERARWLWQQAGSPDGRDLEFWLQAERALRTEGGELGNQDGVMAESGQDAAEQQQSNPNNFAPHPWQSSSS
jgi:hypothetical protein